MPEVRHAVPLPDGSVANTVGPNAVIAEMYPVGLTDPTPLYVGRTLTEPVAGLRLTPANSALKFLQLEGDETAILGNTVTRLCPRAQSCGNCALGGAGLSVAEMSAQNCARANTAIAFERAGVPPEGRFMLLPTAAKDADGKSFNDYFVVDDNRLHPEYNGDELMQYKLDASYAVVFTKSWLQEKGLTKIGTGMQGADGSKGVAVGKFDDPLDTETLIIPFCSLRQNMGDRAEEHQILRSALNAYFDSKQYDAPTRERLLHSLQISVSFAASASLRNFAHQVQLPEPGSRKDAEIRTALPELVARAGGRITTAIVLSHEYAGALDRGNIWPQFEAAAGIRKNPITPDDCPGDGQSCHVDYGAETEYALTKQLQDMGVPAANISYNGENVFDPADGDNNAASNRREQNGLEVDSEHIGVAVPKTNRTLNAMVIEL